MADSIEQLDLALDQLAVRDRNFDRFALMLIDNVVELTLHRFAQDKQHEKQVFRLSQEGYHERPLAKALGRDFDSKVALARLLGILSEREAESVRNLHRFRNAAHHQGVRHERILHSLTKFYLGNACELFKKYQPFGWSSSSADIIPYRARKYLGSVRYTGKEQVELVWDRLIAIVGSLGDSLVSDLSADMEYVIENIDSAIEFLASDVPRVRSRNDALLSAQAWDLSFSSKAQTFAVAQRYKATNRFDLVEWLKKSFPWAIRNDPIPSWNARLDSLQRETDEHVAFKKYCDFMQQTEKFRSVIEEAARGLDSEIQHQIDVARGK